MVTILSYGFVKFVVNEAFVLVEQVAMWPTYAWSKIFTMTCKLIGQRQTPIGVSFSIPRIT